MFSYIFSYEPAEDSQKKHEEFPEIMDPFFPVGMGMCMYFHLSMLDDKY
jgi:hypothetical protein